MKNQKGFAPIFLVVILAFASLVGIWIYINNFSIKQKLSTPGILETNQATHVSTDDWKKYSEEEFPLTFKYPGNWSIAGKEMEENNNIVYLRNDSYTHQISIYVYDSELNDILEKEKFCSWVELEDCTEVTYNDLHFILVEGVKAATRIDSKIVYIEINSAPQTPRRDPDPGVETDEMSPDERKTFFRAFLSEVRSINNSEANDNYNDLQTSINEKRTLYVVISLNIDYSVEARLSPEEINSQRDKIKDIQEKIIKSLSGTNFEVYKQYESLPNMAIKVDKEALDVLINSYYVSSIQEDKPVMFR